MRSKNLRAGDLWLCVMPISPPPTHCARDGRALGIGAAGAWPRARSYAHVPMPMAYCPSVHSQHLYRASRIARHPTPSASPHQRSEAEACASSCNLARRKPSAINTLHQQSILTPQKRVKSPTITYLTALCSPLPVHPAPQTTPLHMSTSAYPVPRPVSGIDTGTAPLSLPPPLLRPHASRRLYPSTSISALGTRALVSAPGPGPAYVAAATASPARPALISAKSYTEARRLAATVPPPSPSSLPGQRIGQCSSAGGGSSVRRSGRSARSVGAKLVHVDHAANDGAAGAPERPSSVENGGHRASGSLASSLSLPGRAELGMSPKSLPTSAPTFRAQIVTPVRALGPIDEPIPDAHPNRPDRSTRFCAAGPPRGPLHRGPLYRSAPRRARGQRAAAGLRGMCGGSSRAFADWGVNTGLRAVRVCGPVRWG
jgi:hypothetical protein